MALTLRPDKKNKNLIEKLKKIYNEKTSSKAIEKAVSYIVNENNEDLREYSELSDKLLQKDIYYKNLTDRPILGERINYKGLIHAPVNELGVVYLFGLISKELGIEIESIQAGFPDCLAKRKVKNGWQNIRIELEYLASNFIKHGHDFTKCDMVVCWENDWLDCPIEVIALKEKIDELKNKRNRLETSHNKK